MHYTLSLEESEKYGSPFFLRAVGKMIVSLSAWLLLFTCVDTVRAQTVGTITEIGLVKSLPVVHVDCSDGLRHTFVINIEMARVVVFRDTSAGIRFMRSHNVRGNSGKPAELVEMDVTFTLNDETEFSPDLVGLMDLPVLDPSRERHKSTDKLTGFIGLRALPHPIIEFDLIENQVKVHESMPSQLSAKSFRLFNGTKGHYSTLLPVGESNWIFRLKTVGQTTISPVLAETLTRGVQRIGSQTELDFSNSVLPTVDVTTDAQNYISIFAFDSTSVIIDRAAMKIHFLNSRQ